MTIEITFQANADTIKVDIPEAEIHEEAAHIVANFRATGGIIAIGETEEELHETSVAGGATIPWERVKSRIDFTAPFNREEFNPKLAVAILEHYAVRARKQLFRGLYPLRSTMKQFSFTLQLQEYEQLPSDARAEFEYLIHRSLSPNTLTINGQVSEKKQYALADRSLRWTSIVSMVIVFLITKALVPQTVLIKFSATNWGSAQFLFMLFAALFVMSFISLFIGTALWLFVMRFFISERYLKPVLASARLPEPVIRWYQKVLLS